MTRNCNYAAIALFVLLLAILKSVHADSTSVVSPTPSTGASLGLQSVQALKSQEKRELRDFVHAQEDELLGLRRKNTADLKQVRDKHSATMKEWESSERDARHKFFAEHKAGRERRAYIQDYKQRREALIASQSQEESEHKGNHQAALESLGHEHQDKFKKFRDFLNRGELPPGSLWPPGTGSK